MNLWQPQSLSFALAPTTQLHNGAFLIHKPLGAGGFGITYYCIDTNLLRHVAVKEFFPANGCSRKGNEVITEDTNEFVAAKLKFIEEARTLARFDHSGIVKVLSVFEENNTAYMVMEFLQGKTLRRLVEEDGVLTETQALQCIWQLGDALQEVHEAHVVHRDVKPENVIVCNGGRAVLLDFGLNKKIEVTGKLQTRRLSMTTPLGTDGYAPPEQYLRNAEVDFSTDIYALAATLYFLLTGKDPVSAPQRALGEPLAPPQNINPNVTSEVNTAILRAMELKEELRPQTVQSLFKLLHTKAQAPRTSSIRTTNNWPQAGRQVIAHQKAPGRTTPAQPSPSATTPAKPPQRIVFKSKTAVIVNLCCGLWLGGMCGMFIQLTVARHSHIFTLLGSVIGVIASLVFVLASNLENVERRITFAIAAGLTGMLIGAMIGAFTFSATGIILCSVIGTAVVGYVGASDKTL